MEDEALRTTQLLDRLERALDFPAYLAARSFKVVPGSSEWGVAMEGPDGVVKLTVDPNKKKWTYLPVVSSARKGCKGGWRGRRRHGLHDAEGVPVLPRGHNQAWSVARRPLRFELRYAWEGRQSGVPVPSAPSRQARRPAAGGPEPRARGPRATGGAPTPRITRRSPGNPRRRGTVQTHPADGRRLDTSLLHRSLAKLHKGDGPASRVPRATPRRSRLRTIACPRANGLCGLGDVGRTRHPLLGHRSGGAMAPGASRRGDRGGLRPRSPGPTTGECRVGPGD